MRAILEWARDHPTEVLTLALVLVTIYYAWQTRRTVREMAAARVASIRPSVRLGFGTLSPDHVYLIVENVGGGPALGVDLRFTLSGFRKGEETDVYATPLLRVGERSKLFYPTWGGDELMALKSLRDVPVRIEVRGTCTDTEGREYGIYDVLDFGRAQDQVAQLPWHLTRSDDVAALDRVAGEVSKLRSTIQARGGG